MHERPDPCPSQSIRTAVIVVNYGSHALVRRNLTALGASRPDLGIYVVDNFTSPRERASLADLAVLRGWTAILNDTNAGFGAGVNRGAAQAIAEGFGRLLLLNPDATISAESVGILEAAVDAEPLALAAPTILTSDGRPWFTGVDLYLDSGRMHSARRRDEHPGQPREEWLTGACLMLRAELWDLLGGFDEEYFLYWEDVDLSHRVTALGGSLRIPSGARAVHDEGGTQARGGAAKSEAYYYFNIRNRMIFAARHLDPEARERWLRESPRESWEILRRGGRRHLLTSVSPWRAAWRGIRDGRRALAAVERPAGDGGPPAMGDRELSQA